jgi:hypothetical protein
LVDRAWRKTEGRSADFPIAATRPVVHDRPRQPARRNASVKNAEKHLSQPIVGSCLVTPRSSAKAQFASAIAGSAGAVARATSDTIADYADRGASPMDSGTASIGMLALTEGEVVLLNGRRGMTRPVATGVAGRGPRQDVVVAEIGSGKLTAPLRLSWADGSTWELSVPRSDMKKARALVEQLAA